MICFVRAAWSEAVNGVLLLHSITVSNGFDQKNSTSIACFYYFGGLTGLAWYHGNHRISGNHKAYPNSFIFKTHHLLLFALVNELFWQLYFLVFASLSPSSERLVCVGKCIFMNALKPKAQKAKILPNYDIRNFFKKKIFNKVLIKTAKIFWRRSALDILNDALLGILGLLCNSTQAAIAKPASLKLKKRCLFLSSCTKSIDFFLAFCIGLRVVNISPNGVSQPKKLKQERYKFHSNQNCLAQKNLTLSRQDHYGIPLVIGYKRKLMCLPYERVIFGLTGSITMYCNTTVCADSWRSSFTLKVVLVRLSFGYPLLIVTSQDSLSIQHWWWRNSGRKEESGRMKKKVFLSCVKNGCEMRENGRIFRIICELKEAFSSNSSTLYAVLSTIKMINLFTVFENH